MTLAELLKEWRRSHFMSQKDLARKLGVAWGTVQRWEASKGLPFPAMQRLLVEELKIPPEELRAALDASEAEMAGNGGKVAA